VNLVSVEFVAMSSIDLGFEVGQENVVWGVQEALDG